jgi:hypothetical protein
MGIVVFLMKKSYLNIDDDKPIIKSDLIYRFLIEGSNIDLFLKQINIFKRDGQKDIIHEIIFQIICHNLWQLKHSLMSIK